MKNECAICGWNKKVEKHHIIKRREFGSDDEENLIFLCPNHHWVADFGTEEDRNLILEEFEKLGKIGKKKDPKFIKRIDDMIFAIEEKNLGKFDETEKEEFRKSSNYSFNKEVLLNKQHALHKKTYKKGEILLLSKLLREELESQKE